MSGYTQQNGEFADLEPAPTLQITATATGYSDPVEFGDRAVGRYLLAATAGAGTSATLDVRIECSPTGLSGSWYTGASFTQVTSGSSFPTAERKLVPIDRFVRAYYTIAVATLIGSVVQTGAGPAMTVTGESDDDYDLMVEITTGGERGTADFQWSLDGGENWEATGVLTAADVVLGTTGLTAHFADDTDGTTSEVVQTGDGPAVTLSGEPDAAYDLVIEVDLEGHSEAGTFQWSLDGGENWEETDVTIPAQASPYALGTTGVSATFTTSTPGANGSITEGGGGDPPDLTLAGEPNAVYDFKIEITTTGGRSAGYFNWSLDDGASWELVEPVVIPADGEYELTGTGVTVTFADASHSDGQTYAWTSTAPVLYELGTTYESTSTAPIDYVDGTTYESTIYEDDPAVSFTFNVSGEAA